MNQEQTGRLFTQTFGTTADIYFLAPGRANIIGEHTDYNNGFVLPFAIGQGVWFYGRKQEGKTLDIIAGNTNEVATLLTDGRSETSYGWQKFFTQVLSACGHLPVPGIQLAFGGDLPIGAGISSSSAITCGFIEILNLLGNWHLSAQEMVELAVTAETGYGVRGGIMDQYTIFNGRQNEAILLDCRSNDHETIPLHLRDCSFLLINTNVKHNLIDTDYNNRRAQCERAVTAIQSAMPYVTSLRDVDGSHLPAVMGLLDELLYRRVAFVVEENDRVLKATEALKSGNTEYLGQLLNQSHKGLSELYEVSCQELDWLADIAVNHPAFAGGRMMGGGFGGCTINLLKKPLTDAEKRDIVKEYTSHFGLAPTFIPVTAENGILENLRAMTP